LGGAEESAGARRPAGAGLSLYPEWVRRMERKDEAWPMAERRCHETRVRKRDSPTPGGSRNLGRRKPDLSSESPFSLTVDGLGQVHSFQRIREAERHFRGKTGAKSGQPVHSFRRHRNARIRRIVRVKRPSGPTGAMLSVLVERGFERDRLVEAVGIEPTSATPPTPLCATSRLRWLVGLGGFSRRSRLRWRHWRGCLCATLV